MKWRASATITVSHSVYRIYIYSSLHIKTIYKGIVWCFWVVRLFAFWQRVRWEVVRRPVSASVMTKRKKEKKLSQSIVPILYVSNNQYRVAIKFYCVKKSNSCVLLTLKLNPRILNTLPFYYGKFPVWNSAKISDILITVNVKLITENQFVSPL